MPATNDVVARQAAMQQLSPEQQRAQQQQYREDQLRRNRIYMKNTDRKTAPCTQVGGGGYTQAWSAGAQLAFQVPTAQNAYLEGYKVRLNLAVTFAAGTSAVYAANACGPLGIIDFITLQYNGVQQRYRPYILKTLSMLQGQYASPIPYTNVAGQTVASRAAYRTSSPAVAVGAQSWIMEFYVPCNLLHPQDARGMLPIMGGETQAQILIQCAPQLLGNDPILNIASVVSGTGHAITVANGGSGLTPGISVQACYRDGTTKQGPQTLALDLNGLPTVQFLRDLDLPNLTTGSVFRNRISVMDSVAWLLATVVDGVQSNLFSTVANMSILDFTQDAVGSSPFWRFGTGSNMNVEEFFFDLFLKLGQDLDPGVVPFVSGPIDNEAAPDTLEGTNYLNTGPSGWTDVHYGAQLTAVGGLTPAVAPRIETHVVYLNSRGLVAG